jgi:enoyl-CoA hydratase
VGATDSEVIVEREGAVALVTINRPQVLNALSSNVLSLLGRKIADLEADADARAIVVTGAGDRAFSAGADLDELASLSSAQAHRHLLFGQSVMRQIELSAKPVIAAVHGWALGGGFELALSCSFVIASSKARFGLPEVGLGLMPGYGGTQRLPRAIGRQNALRLTLTGKPIDADAAYELGILSERPVAPDDLRQTVLQSASVIASNGPAAVQLILEASRASDQPAGALAHEAALGGIAIGSDEGKEGIAAFLQKRSPEFGKSL